MSTTTRTSSSRTVLAIVAFFAALEGYDLACYGVTVPALLVDPALGGDDEPGLVLAAMRSASESTSLVVLADTVDCELAHAVVDARVSAVIPTSSHIDDVLRTLAAARLPVRLEAIAIASPDDALIVPADGAHWAEACNVSVEGSGHLHLLVSARVHGIIAENLEAVPESARRHHGE